MSQIDEHYIVELRSQLTSLRAEWNRIRGPGNPRTGGMSSCSAVANFFCDRFSEWANSVVQAFGVDEFPTYCKPPATPSLEDKLNLPDGVSTFLEKETKALNLAGETPSNPMTLVGIDDHVQAGLRLLLWAAAYRSPDLFDCESGTIAASNLKSGVKHWAILNLTCNVSGNWHARTKLGEWIEIAFDELEKKWKLQRIPEADRVVVSLAELARLLFGSDDDTPKARIQDWIRRGKIQAIRTGTRGDYLVCKSALEIQIRAAKEISSQET